MLPTIQDNAAPSQEPIVVDHSALSAAVTPEVGLASRSLFMVSAWYDLTFFILAPVWGLCLAYLGYRFMYDQGYLDVAFRQPLGPYIAVFMSSIFVQAHLVLVFFRSHLNKDIFRQFRARFTLIPVLLVAGMYTSQLAFRFLFVMSRYWDVYHSSMQTFGLMRLYEKRAGNSVEEGRTDDIWLNHFIYIGPLLGGFNLLGTLQFINPLLDTNEVLNSPIWGPLFAHRDSIRLVILCCGCLFGIYYAIRLRQRLRRGYRFPYPKFLLLGSTFGVCLYTFSYLPPPVAIGLSNVFHALQYFAIVWWSERKNITFRLGLSQLRAGIPIALGLLVFFAFGYSAISYRFGASCRFMAVATTCVSLLHFWYDGFVWSVRRQQV